MSNVKTCLKYFNRPTIHSFQNSHLTWSHTLKQKQQSKYVPLLNGSCGHLFIFLCLCKTAHLKQARNKVCLCFNICVSIHICVSVPCTFVARGNEFNISLLPVTCVFFCAHMTALTPSLRSFPCWELSLLATGFHWPSPCERSLTPKRHLF